MDLGKIDHSGRAEARSGDLPVFRLEWSGWPIEPSCQSSLAGGFPMSDRTEDLQAQETASTSLAEEWAIYQANLPGWLEEHEGEHVLIKGSEVVGFFEDREEALMTGYARFGLVPLLVKQVTAFERIYNISNIII